MLARSGPHHLVRLARATGTPSCRSSLGFALPVGSTLMPASQKITRNADGEARPVARHAERGPVAFKGRQLRQPRRRAANCWTRPPSPCRTHRGEAEAARCLRGVANLGAACALGAASIGHGPGAPSAFGLGRFAYRRGAISAISGLLRGEAATATTAASVRGATEPRPGPGAGVMTRRPRSEGGRACGVDSNSVIPANCAALAVRESTAWYRVRASSTWRGLRVEGGAL